MAIKFEKIEAGMTLYDRHKVRAGNTTMMREGEWPVEIVSVDRERGSALVRWNGNLAQPWRKSKLEKLFRTRKESKG